MLQIRIIKIILPKPNILHGKHCKFKYYVKETDVFLSVWQVFEMTEFDSRI